MDNFGSHKSRAVRHAIRAAGARLFFLPKYSPDLNPIEQFFANEGAALLQINASSCARCMLGFFAYLTE